MIPRFEIFRIWGHTDANPPRLGYRHRAFRSVVPIKKSRLLAIAPTATIACPGEIDRDVELISLIHTTMLKKRHNKSTFLPSSCRMHWRTHQNARCSNKYLTTTIKILLSACTIIFKDLYLF